MLVRKMPVKLALETRQMGWTEQGGCEQRVSLSVCVYVSLSSICPSIYPQCVCQCDFEQTHRLLKLTLHIHCSDLRRKPSCTSHERTPAPVSRMSFLQQSTYPRKGAVIKYGAQMPGLDPLSGSFCMRHSRGLEQGEDYGKEAQGSTSGQLLFVFVFQHCQF